MQSVPSIRTLSNMMFDNSSPDPTPIRTTLRQHLPMIVFVVGAVGFAAGIHLASATAFVIAGGHLAVAAFVTIARRMRSRTRTEARR